MFPSRDLAAEHSKADADMILLEQRLCCHLEYSHVACHLVVRVGVNVGGEVLTEMSQHGRHVLLCDGVRSVQVHDRFFQVSIETTLSLCQRFIFKT